MKRSQQALAVGAAAGALAFLAAKRRGISLKTWLRVQAEIAHIVIQNTTKDGNWRWSRLRELLFLASLERSRRLEVAEADAKAFEATMMEWLKKWKKGVGPPPQPRKP